MEQDFDDYIPIKAAREHFISKPTLPTIRAWIEDGFANLKNPNGPNIRLHARREGARIFTRVAWINQFKAALLENRRKRRR